MLEANITEFDLGTLEPNTKREFSFQVTNTGTKAIDNIKVNASCGCTTPTLGKVSAEPGESVDVFASFDTTNKKGFQKKHVFVQYIDPETNLSTTLNIPFKANINA